MTTHQPTLFGGSDAYGGHLTPVPIPVRAANGDPVTSHEAAERAERSGKVARHRAIVLALIKAWPKRTGYEVWELAGPCDKAELGSLHEWYRRAADLKNRGLVKHGDQKRCSIRGSNMVTWVALP